MTNEHEFTRVNTNALLLIAVGLLAGFIGGYVIRPHLQPRTSPPNVIESIAFTDEYTEKFPYTFANRSAAVTWLARNISFLDRQLPATDPARADVEQMKFQLSEIRAKPTADLPIVLFKRVNANVEQLQLTLGTQTGTHTPATEESPQSIIVPRRDR